MSLLKSGVNLIWKTFENSGFYKIAKPWYGGLGSILMFHRVRNHNEASNLDVTKNLEISSMQLESLISYLRRKGYSFVSLDEMHQRILEGDFSKRFICLTFDDGFKDNLSVAYPLLKRERIPFALYVATCFPDGTACLREQSLEALLQRNKQVSFDLGRGEETLYCRTEIEKNEAYRWIEEKLMEMPFEKEDLFLSSILDRYKIDRKQLREQLCLTWQEITSLACDPLVTIGAHSVNHVPLVPLNSISARDEIRSSKTRLEDKLHKKVNHFSYPYGHWAAAHHREFDLVKESGFATAVTTRSGNIFPEHAEFAFCLPRIRVEGSVGGDICSEIEKKLCGFPMLRARDFRRLVTA